MSTATEVEFTETSSAPVLFGSVEFDGFAQHKTTRTKVEVPAEILELLTKARTERKRPIWPVRDVTHFDSMANVLYSAGDLLGASVLVAPIKRDGEGNAVVLKREQRGEATHLRATVGERRGQKGGNKAEDKGE